MSEVERRLEKIICAYWERSNAHDGTADQWAEWRAVKLYLWGFEIAASAKGARDSAAFLAGIATIRGAMK